VYNETSRNGFALGFLEHDAWKSGIEYHGNILSAVSGINGKLLTRDVDPHGFVTARHSSLLSIGSYADWRDGMEEYARMQRDPSGNSSNGGAGKPVALPTGIRGFEEGSKGALAPIAGWNNWGTAVVGGHCDDPSLECFSSVSHTLANLSSPGPSTLALNVEVILTYPCIFH
jgi:hypothetical protein